MLNHLYWISIGWIITYFTRLSWKAFCWLSRPFPFISTHLTLRIISQLDITLFLFTVLGTFPWPWEKKGKASALDEYGLGLVFYFKLLKSLAILFTVIAAVTIPSIGLYLSAKTTTSSTQKYTLLTHSGSLLGTKVSIMTHRST